MKKDLYQLLRETLERCFEEGELLRTPVPEFLIEVPNNPEHGDFATNLALTLASSQGRPPREIASVITGHLNSEDKLLEKVEVAGAGFINFRIKREHWLHVLGEVLRLKEDYGRSRMGNGNSILMEFVSANPTGPLHLGHGRGAALGDTLSRILAYTGHHVTREFYINDTGHQIRLLGISIYSRWRQTHEPDFPFPEEGYHGQYILELAKVISGEKDLKKLSEEEAIEYCSHRGKEILLREIKDDLEAFRVPFDSWFSETELFRSGRIDETLRKTQEKGHSYEQEGALWIKTSEFGDDKDRVIKKKNGENTYFASDIAYHLEKRSRGYTRAINLWGADHHGYVPRMKAALSSYEIPEEWLSVLLIQLVKLWKGGQEIKMSKRTGRYVTLRELIDEVGVDAARFVFMSKNNDSPLDFDIDLVKRQDSDNPVYYVQYAHARICSIFRKAAEQGILLEKPPDELFDLLTLEEELGLIRRMAEFPYLLEEISMRLEPHRLVYYLTDLASLFHKYFNLGTNVPDYRVVTSDKSLSLARLSLVEGVRTVIANGLSLLGVSAPESM